MDLKTQKYLEPFIVAQNAGKTIQKREPGLAEWEDLKDDETILGLAITDELYPPEATITELRIKPEPREFWVAPFSDIDKLGLPDDMQYRQVGPGTFTGIFKVREVI